jgi:uncharacterized protein YbjT (DUF2867 family)
MREIDKSKLVLVTGGSGYVASWIIKMLLEEGINVNATVRDPLNTTKIDQLMALAKALAGKLKLSTLEKFAQVLGKTLEIKIA